MVEKANSEGKRQPFYFQFVGGVKAGNGLRKRSLSKSDGMLFAKDGDVHDFGKRLYSALWILCGQSR